MSYEQDQRMIRKQAELISTLNASVHTLSDRIQQLEAEVAKYRTAGEFYLRMQAEIIANPTLQPEWERFLAFLKLAMEKPEELGA